MEEINHQFYEIFPTVIYRGEINSHREFKEKYLEELCDYWHYHPSLPREQFTTPENSGRYFLHHNQNYKQFFKNLVDNVRQYLKILDVDEKKLNVYITKSWVNIQQEDSPEIKIHSHNCSDISFCYYLQCNETSDKLCLHRKENPNEVSEFMFQTTINPENNLITKFNKFNCSKYTVSPIEGTVLLFPSSMLHSTLNTAHRTIDRISVCGDITLTLKEGNEKCEFSRIDPSTWRSY